MRQRPTDCCTTNYLRRFAPEVAARRVFYAAIYLRNGVAYVPTRTGIVRVRDIY